MYLVPKCHFHCNISLVYPDTPSAKPLTHSVSSATIQPSNYQLLRCLLGVFLVCLLLGFRRIGIRSELVEKSCENDCIVRIMCETGRKVWTYLCFSVNSLYSSPGLISLTLVSILRCIVLNFSEVKSPDSTISSSRFFLMKKVTKKVYLDAIYMIQLSILYHV